LCFTHCRKTFSFSLILELKVVGRTGEKEIKIKIFSVEWPYWHFK
jgi:hypothetical protein